MEYTLDSLRQKTDAELAALVKDGLMNDVCHNDDLPLLRYLADERHLPIDVECKGQTPLMLAAQDGSLDMLNLLLERGADVNWVSSSNETALYWAAAGNRPWHVMSLLDFGAKAATADEAEEELLFRMLPYPEVLDRILDVGCDPDFTYGYLPSLLECCCYPDYYDFDEYETTGMRVDRSMLEPMQVLLNHGASPYLTHAYQGRTIPLPDNAAGRRLTELIEKARHEATPSVELYLELWNQRVDRDSFFPTLLRYAEKGADLTAARPWIPHTNLMGKAVWYGSVEAVKYLLSKGCRWESDSDYWWPACMSGSRAMIQYLTEVGMQPRNTGILWRAVYARWTIHNELLWLPFEMGWRPEPTDDGFTVLHALALNGEHPEALPLFIAYVERMGLDTEPHTSSQMTPRSIAEKRGLTALLHYLNQREGRPTEPSQNEGTSVIYL